MGETHDHQRYRAYLRTAVTAGVSLDGVAVLPSSHDPAGRDHGEGRPPRQADRIRYYLLTAVIAGMSLAGPALAQPACAPRDRIVMILAERYGEVLMGAGLQSATQMLEIFTSLETGSWTVLITHVDGISCIAASGTDWLNAELDKVSI